LAASATLTRLGSSRVRSFSELRMRIFSVTVGEYYQQLWDNDYYLTPTGRVYPPAAAVVHGLTTIITKRLPNQRDYSRRPPWSKPGRLTEPKTGVRTTALFCLANPLTSSGWL
jgi:hypothetical protein